MSFTTLGHEFHEQLRARLISPKPSNNLQPPFCRSARPPASYITSSLSRSFPMNRMRRGTFAFTPKGTTMLFCSPMKAELTLAMLRTKQNRLSFLWAKKIRSILQTSKKNFCPDWMLLNMSNFFRQIFVENLL